MLFEVECAKKRKVKVLAAKVRWEVDLNGYVALNEMESVYNLCYGLW